MMMSVIPQKGSTQFSRIAQFCGYLPPAGIWRLNRALAD
jgi:hypothetical protein